MPDPHSARPVFWLGRPRDGSYRNAGSAWANYYPLPRHRCQSKLGSEADAAVHAAAVHAAEKHLQEAKKALQAFSEGLQGAFAELKELALDKPTHEEGASTSSGQLAGCSGQG